MIYLDNAATTRILPQVFEKMMPYLTDEFGNPGSNHELGFRAKQAVEYARGQVADLIGADPDQIIFTSSGSEANSLAILGTDRYRELSGRDKILTDYTEHESVLKTKPIRDRYMISPDQNGVISPSDVHGGVAFYDDVGLVSVMMSNNETGALNPVSEIGSICRKYNVLFHTDCVQSAGFHDIKVNSLGCDLLSISGHKIGAPKGTGALFVRDKNILNPLIRGGNSQEFGYRGGTENVAGIVGFGMACEIANKQLKKNRETVFKLKDIFLNRFAHIFGYDEYCINGYERDSKIVNVTFFGIDAASLVLFANSNGLCISAGAACQSNESNPSRVLTSMGISKDDARCSVRISFSPENTKGEANEAVEILRKCVTGIREMKAV